MRIQRLHRFTSPAFIVATAALLAACSTPGPMQSSTGPGDLPAGQVPGKPEVTPQMASAAE
ncbi:MAG: peptidase M48, partial [Oxalobacteraceae bacterium]